MRLSKISSVVHVCEFDAYESIFEHGLRPAAEICADFGCSPEERDAHLHRPRTEPVPHGPHPTQGSARLAHNQPLLKPAFQKHLEASFAASGCTLEEYCKLLNNRTYFWADFRFANGAVAGKAAGYTNEVTGGDDFDVIRVPFGDLKGLAAEQGLGIELTNLNSGSAPRSTTRRGPDTWTPLADHAPDEPVQEVTVVGRLRGLADVAEVIRFEGGKTKLIWMRRRR